MELAFFYLVALVAVTSALVAIGHKNPVINVLALMVTFFCVAMNFAMLGADFLAGAQVLIYAGAILVLFLFVVMLLGAPRVTDGDDRRPLQRVVSLTAVLMVAFGGFFLFQGLAAPTAELPELGNTARALGRLLVGPHLFAFELVSVLLLAALVGALVLVKRKH